MIRKGYLSACSARWISCLSEKERERVSYKKRDSKNNYSVWVYFPTQKQIIKILIRMTMIKTVYQDSHRSPGLTQKDRPAGNPKSTTDTPPGQDFLHKQNYLQSGSWVWGTRDPPASSPVRTPSRNWTAPPPSVTGWRWWWLLLWLKKVLLKSDKRTKTGITNSVQWWYNDNKD